MKKNRNWYWFAISLFPLVLIVAYFLGAHGAVSSSSVVSTVTDCLSAFKVDIFADMYDTILDAISWTAPSALISYVSYLTLIVFLRLVYELLVFLPKFCISVFERRK